MENVSEKMTKEELLDLFSKYDLVELTAMNTVLNYAKDVDTVEAQTAIRKVFKDADVDRKRCSGRGRERC